MIYLAIATDPLQNAELIRLAQLKPSHIAKPSSKLQYVHSTYPTRKKKLATRMASDQNELLRSINFMLLVYTLW